MPHDFKVQMLAFAEPPVVRTVTLSDKVYQNVHQDRDALLEMIYKHGQNDFQPRECPSVSKGDVVELTEDGKLRRFIVQSIGFREISPEEMVQYLLTPRRDRHFHPLTDGLDDEETNSLS